MNYAIDRITLDVHSSACQGTLRWKHGDTARRIVASFTENGKPWEFQSDCEISLYIKKPDGTVVWGHCINPDANNAGSVVHYDIIGDETVLPGKLECEFRVYSRSKLLTSPRFNVIVDETVYNEDAIYSENRETFLTESVNKMISATAEAKAVSNEVQTKLDNGEFDGKDGKDGTNGYTPIKGVDYFDGKNGIDGTKWFSGTTDVSGGGYPVYMIAGAVKGDYHLNVITGYICKAGEKYWEFLCNLKGKDGVVGKNGVDGKDGTDGKSAYEYAVEGGYDESEEAFYGDLANVGSAGGGASLSDELPLMNGEASPGVSEEAARIDHVHPRDTGLMPAMNQMNIKVTPNETDRFPYYDNAVKTMVYTTFARFLSALKKSIDTVKNAETAELATKANALIDASGVYTAVLPEGMTENGILALQSDIVKVLVGYATEEYVKGYAQEKGEYQPAGEYLVPTDLSKHNTSEDSHNDIRLLLDGLAARLNALADSDDDTLDQLSEVVEYIKANRGLIEGVTTSKVSVSDIINNLATNVADKPLSAAQGVALKALIDAITVPTKLSELSGDSTHRIVTDAEKAAWNAKSNFSGKYADLEGKPTIPTVPTKVSAFENDKGYVTDDKTITITGVDENEVTHTWTVYGVKS